MGKTIVEKIIAAHCGRDVKPGDIADVKMDVRIARDFGGANVVKNILRSGLGVDDPKRTFFTFDCNPGGSDQKYAANQQLCRKFAREKGIEIFDISRGIGTHISVDRGWIVPGGTLVSTDSHANIVGAVGAFGQGMGDVDIAAAFAHGSVWFEVPPAIKIEMRGMPGPNASAKDVTLAMAKELGASGLLGCAAEIYGEYVLGLDLSGRVTIASMATEMGGIIILFPPNEEVVEYCRARSSADFQPVFADRDAKYRETVQVDIDGLEPMASRPGHPEDVIPVSELRGKKIDSGFIGSCTNGRYEDLAAAADVLKGRKVAPGVVLKIVPSTNEVWKRCLEDGLIKTFKDAGALFGNAGCAGCAAGQIGQNGPGEVTVSTGNRNYKGKQGQGEVFLASPATVAASAVAGMITTVDAIPGKPAVFKAAPAGKAAASKGKPKEPVKKPVEVEGKAWVVEGDNIDTDMIYHNKYLAVTDLAETGKYAFCNLDGWTDFPKKAKPGDIVVTGANFGCGSSRQQAVDCFKALGVSAVIAVSFGAIYKRNAINAALPIMTAPALEAAKTGDTLRVNFETGTIENVTQKKKIKGTPFSKVQTDIYKRGGLL
ncbi:MAG: aconitase/3-isopropylmalate dehydratase large subunit family protein [Planctomycetota bacterium]|jgi:3-isopropylmalate dehydratase small subunit